MKKNHLSLALAITIPIVFCLTLPFVGFLPFSTGDYIYDRLIFGILGTIYAYLLTYLLLRIDGISFQSIGMVWDRGTLFRFIKGLGIGLLIAGIMMFIIIQSTQYTIIKNEDIHLPKALFGLLAFLPLALMEEIIYRGYPFLSIKKILGIRAAQLSMAVLFAFYHDTTGASLPGQLLGPGVWALTYGYFALRSGGIALPTGIHAAVNVVLAVLGTKHADYAIWTIIPEANLHESSTFMTNYMGTFLQIGLLIFGIYLTERYIRKGK